MSNTVQSWLNGDRDYAEGVQLLRDHQVSNFLINLLAPGPDAFNTPKLLSEIQKLPATSPAVSQLPAMAGEASTASHNEAMAAVSDLEWQVDSIESILSDLTSQVDAMQAATDNPTSEAGIYTPDYNLEKKMRYDAQIKQLWKEICYLHAQMDLLPEGDQLYQVAQELLVKDMRRADLWNHLHYFNANGVWFDDLPENQPKPENPEQEIRNLMANRSKAKANLKKPQTKAKKQFFQDKVDSLTAEIENLKALRYA